MKTINDTTVRIRETLYCPACFNNSDIYIENDPFLVESTLVGVFTCGMCSNIFTVNIEFRNVKNETD